jgi:hypothetical protein
MDVAILACVHTATAAAAMKELRSDGQPAISASTTVMRFCTLQYGRTQSCVVGPDS